MKRYYSTTGEYIEAFDGELKTDTFKAKEVSMGVETVLRNKKGKLCYGKSVIHVKPLDNQTTTINVKTPFVMCAPANKFGEAINKYYSAPTGITQPELDKKYSKGYTNFGIIGGRSGKFCTVEDSNKNIKCNTDSLISSGKFSFEIDNDGFALINTPTKQVSNYCTPSFDGIRCDSVNKPDVLNKFNVLFDIENDVDKPKIVLQSMNEKYCTDDNNNKLVCNSEDYAQYETHTLKLS